VTVLLAVTAAGCASSGGSRVLVSAAASLTDVFATIESSFEDIHPETDIVLNLAGSSTLREQILEGSPADVYASANKANMDQIVAAGRVAGDPVVFASNRLQIAVPAGNPAGIGGLADFGRDELLIGLCAPDVPCGSFAAEALANAGVVPAVDTYEPNVRALLTKVELGELDAAIVYATDVVSARGTVDGIEIPADQNVQADYWIAVLADAPNPAGARAFVDFVLSGDGRRILASFGFGTP
jgi:molybdate transport system substrate-binding protein